MPDAGSSPMVPLDPDALVDAAMRVTGLDDLGEGPWRDGLDVLCESVEREAECNAIGHASLAGRIQHFLTSRLAVVDWHARHPEIAREVVVAPVVVLGLPRTGTTALTHLLALDAQTRSLREWEAAAPTPPPEAATYTTDPRIAVTQAGIDASHEMVPGLAELYEADATSPAEQLDLHGMSFRCFQLDGMAHIPSYIDWLLDADMAPSYAQHRRTLQLLQWRCPPTRWQLKNPPDLFFVDEVDAAYPGTTFVWTHRAPARVLPSVCSLISLITAMGADGHDPATVGPRQTALWARGVERGMAARDSLGESRFVDVHMHELASDPLGVLERIYDAAGWPLTDDTVRAAHAWLAAHPPGRHPHEPDPARFGLDPDEIADRFAAYEARFQTGART